MKEKITVDDDDRSLLREIKVILKNEGYDVQTIDSTVFTQVIEQLKPDLLLLDVWFGNNSSGITQAQAVKQTLNLRSVPVVLMSSDPSVAEYAVKSQADGYLRKPLDIDELLTTLNSILN